MGTFILLDLFRSAMASWLPPATDVDNSIYYLNYEYDYYALIMSMSGRSL